MKKVANLAVKIGTYQKDGETKNRYINIGSKMQNDDGSFFFLMNRTFNPAGVSNPDNRDSILISVFDIKEESKQAAQEDLSWQQ